MLTTNGVIPDVEVIPSKEDMLIGRDAAVEYIKQMADHVGYLNSALKQFGYSTETTFISNWRSFPARGWFKSTMMEFSLTSDTRTRISCPSWEWA